MNSSWLVATLFLSQISLGKLSEHKCTKTGDTYKLKYQSIKDTDTQETLCQVSGKLIVEPYGYIVINELTLKSAKDSLVHVFPRYDDTVANTNQGKFELKALTLQEKSKIILTHLCKANLEQTKLILNQNSELQCRGDFKSNEGVIVDIGQNTRLFINFKAVIDLSKNAAIQIESTANGSFASQDLDAADMYLFGIHLMPESKITLEEGAKLIVKKDARLRLAPKAQLTLKNNAQLTVDRELTLAQAADGKGQKLTISQGDDVSIHTLLYMNWDGTVTQAEAKVLSGTCTSKCNGKCIFPDAAAVEKKKKELCKPELKRNCTTEELEEMKDTLQLIDRYEEQLNMKDSKEFDCRFPEKKQKKRTEF